MSRCSTALLRSGRGHQFRWNDRGWRYFDNGKIKSTTGIMDLSIGVRYQIFNEADAPYSWLPTLTVSGGRSSPGTYKQKTWLFRRGLRSAAIEPIFVVPQKRTHVRLAGFDRPLLSMTDHWITDMTCDQQERNYLGLSLRHQI